MLTFVSSPVFMYPEYLPEKGFKHGYKPARAQFHHAEDVYVLRLFISNYYLALPPPYLLLTSSVLLTPYSSLLLLPTSYSLSLARCLLPDLFATSSMPSPHIPPGMG